MDDDAPHKQQDVGTPPVAVGAPRTLFDTVDVESVDADRVRAMVRQRDYDPVRVANLLHGVLDIQLLYEMINMDDNLLRVTAAGHPAIGNSPEILAHALSLNIPEVTRAVVNNPLVDLTMLRHLEGVPGLGDTAREAVGKRIEDLLLIDDSLALQGFGLECNDDSVEPVDSQPADASLTPRTMPPQEDVSSNVYPLPPRHVPDAGGTDTPAYTQAANEPVVETTGDQLSMRDLEGYGDLEASTSHSDDLQLDQNEVEAEAGFSSDDSDVNDDLLADVPDEEETVTITALEETDEDALDRDQFIREQTARGAGPGHASQVPTVTAGVALWYSIGRALHWVSALWEKPSIAEVVPSEGASALNEYASDMRSKMVTRLEKSLSEYGMVLLDAALVTKQDYQNSQLYNADDSTREQRYQRDAERIFALGENSGSAQEVKFRVQDIMEYFGDAPDTTSILGQTLAGWQEEYNSHVVSLDDIAGDLDNKGSEFGVYLQDVGSRFLAGLQGLFQGLSQSLRPS